jgi:hypothetical protein
MDLNTAIDIIIKDLREAREIIDDFKNYQGVPEFQVELAKSKCKSAEELIALLKAFKATPSGKKTSVPAQPVITELKQAKPVEKSGEEIIPVKEKPKAKIESRGKTDLIELSDDESAEVSSEKIESKQESNIIADKFSEPSSTLHEQLGITPQEEIISSVLKSKPVEDLSTAIGVNDKFHFIREVFGGNQASYLEAIVKLNKAETLADAKAVIMSYTGDSEENEAITQLLDLVKRKLGSDE